MSPFTGVFLAGMALLLVGLGFKVAAVPFHTWTPDVYQGSPTPATAFMAATAKAAGFAGLLRVFSTTFTTAQLDWKPIVWALAVLTMLVGSVLAVVQNDIKRMLAYSSISHAGFVLIGLQANNREGIAGALFYLLAYTFMVVGSFAVVTVVGRRGDADHSLDAYRGLSVRRPGLALEFYVISAAVKSHSYALALIAMLSAVIAAFFYLRVTVLMYMAPPAAEAGEGGEAAPAPVALPATVAIAVVAAAAFTVAFGLVPSPVIQFARQATLLF